jgi:hypothetical protein
MVEYTFYQKGEKMKVRNHIIFAVALPLSPMAVQPDLV